MDLKEHGITGGFSQTIIDYIEELKELLSSKIWEDIFLSRSKNEVFVFWLLYQRGEVNMTEIADYIHVPLNTATGIINRMEKSGLIVRTRSTEDKRVVNIGFSEKGMLQFEASIGEIVAYGTKVVSSFTKEEMGLLGRVTSKTLEILREEDKKEKVPKKVRRITLE